jgi:phage shock protein PspC (stress-responsive transcriptional regulator)
MSKLKNFLVGAALVAAPFSAFVPQLHAQDLTSGAVKGNLDAVQQDSGLGDKDLDETLGLLINVLLGLLGIIFLVLVIYAGFLWMTAGGDEKRVAKAKSIIITAVIGLVILLSAYAISSFVLDQLISATGSGA